MDSLEVEVDDDVVEKLTILEALQVLGCHSNAALGGGRRVLDQPGGKFFKQATHRKCNFSFQKYNPLC